MLVQMDTLTQWRGLTGARLSQEVGPRLEPDLLPSGLGSGWSPVPLATDSECEPVAGSVRHVKTHSRASPLSFGLRRSGSDPQNCISNKFPGVVKPQLGRQ